MPLFDLDRHGIVQAEAYSGEGGKKGNCPSPHNVLGKLIITPQNLRGKNMG